VRARRFLAVAVTLLAGAGGSGGGCGKAERDTGVSPAAWAYPEHQFVIDAITVPLTSSQATQLAFDFDGNGTADNQLGTVFAALGSQMGETTPQTSVNDAIRRGRIVVLLALFVQPDMQDSPRSNLWAFLGKGADPPLTDGPQPGSSFAVDPSDPSDSYTGGSIRAGAGVYEGEEATMLLDLPIAAGGETTFAVPLTAVHVQFQASADGLALTEGKLGGVVTKENLDATIKPGVVALLNDEMRQYCQLPEPGSCTCPSGSGAETIRNMFDSNGDCVLSLDELEANPIVAALLAPDVTLPDGRTGLSAVIGFHAVTASFVHVAPPSP
jgi:hypothetical protein